MRISDWSSYVCSSDLSSRRASSARSANFIRSPKRSTRRARGSACRSGTDRQFPAERDAPVLIISRHRLIPRIGDFDADGGIVGVGEAHAAAPTAKPEIGARNRGAFGQRHIGIVDKAEYIDL